MGPLEPAITAGEASVGVVERLVAEE